MMAVASTLLPRQLGWSDLIVWYISSPRGKEKLAKIVLGSLARPALTASLRNFASCRTPAAPGYFAMALIKRLRLSTVILSYS